MNILLVFFYVFGFNFYKGRGLDSTMLVGIFLIIYALANNKYFNKIINCIRSKYVTNLLVLYVIINVWILIVLLANKTCDFSFVKTFLHMLFQFLVGICLFLYFQYKEKEQYIVNYLINAFGIQTLIQWLAFLFPIVKNIVNFTKSSVAIDLGLKYGEVRVVALAGSDFFGLSAAYAIVFLLYWSKHNTLFQDNKAYKMIYYMFIVSGTFFAGRTGYVGLICVILYYIADAIIYKKNIWKNVKIKEMLYSFVAVVGLVGIIAILVFQFRNDYRFTRLFNFSFQMIFNKLNNDTFMISSLESLSKMYFEIPLDTFIVGDGLYLMETGSYYMNTDVGYMRVILYMGIIGFILMLLMQGFIIKPLKKGENLMKGMLFALLLILNLKGEVIAFGLMVQGVVILYSLLDSFCINGKDNNCLSN